MAGFFRKRRGPSGPSKNEQKVMRAAAAERQARSGGTLAERFPTVKRLVVKLELLSPQKQALSEETRSFEAKDICKLAVPCPGRCGNGSFDLAGKIEAVVLAEQPVSEASGLCKKPLYAGAADVCGCELRCKIEIVYLPKPEPAPEPAPEGVPNP